MFNSIGSLLRITTFGESHGPGLGCVADGCPAGIELDTDQLISQLHRRRPGQSAITSARKEGDNPEILSGIFEGRSLGTPITIIIFNHDQRSGDYEAIRRKPRKGHADQTWKDKFGHVDHRGGGRASGRETASRVMGGWVAESILGHFYPETSIVAHVSAVGEHRLQESETYYSREQVDANPVRCPDAALAETIEARLADARSAGESYGGEVTVTIRNPPLNLGEPVFLKAQNYLASALTSIGTVNGISWNERPVSEPGSMFHSENNYGGLNGGITNGHNLRLRLICKPVSTLGDTARKGRHDPCVLPRIVPVVEAMTAIVLADLALMQRARSL